MSDELPEWYPSIEDAEAQARGLVDRNYSTPPESTEVLLRELDRVREENKELERKLDDFQDRWDHAVKWGFE